MKKNGAAEEETQHEAGPRAFHVDARKRARWFESARLGACAGADRTAGELGPKALHRCRERGRGCCRWRAERLNAKGGSCNSRGRSGVLICWTRLVGWRSRTVRRFLRWSCSGRRLHSSRFSIRWCRSDCFLHRSVRCGRRNWWRERHGAA